MSEVATKQITVVENQVGMMVEAVEKLPIQITNQKEYDQVYEVGQNVQKLLKAIDKKEKSITKPINDSLKQIRGLFKPFKTQVEEVKEDLKRRRLSFINDEENRKAKLEESVVGRVERGTMREDTAVTKLAEAEANSTDTRGGITSVLVVTVDNLKEIPDEYLTVNESALKAAYREGKTDIPGVTFAYEKRARA